MRAAVIVNILTAVTRPENIPPIRNSVFAAEEAAPGVAIKWWQRTDPQRAHVGGQHLKNMMLTEIDYEFEDSWVCILDDDTIMHPSFLRKVYRAHRQHPEAQAIVVSQRRTTGVVLKACRENMVVGKVDAGQVVIRRSLIGDLLIPETYAGDGEWLECLLRYEPDVVFLPEVLSLHNALSGVDVSETPERMGA